jgi:hypothetical protein
MKMKFPTKPIVLFLVWGIAAFASYEIMGIGHSVQAVVPLVMALIVSYAMFAVIK